MPIAQLLELWKKIEVEPMDIEVSTRGDRILREPGGGAARAAEGAPIARGLACDGPWNM